MVLGSNGAFYYIKYINTKLFFRVVDSSWTNRYEKKSNLKKKKNRNILKIKKVIFARIIGIYNLSS